MSRTSVTAGDVQTRDEKGGLEHQAKALASVLLLVAGIVLFLGAIILIVYYTTHINVHHLVADPSEIAFLPEYTGVYSYLGVLLLWTAAVLSVVAGYLARLSRLAAADASFLMTFGLLLGWLAADDLFMWHEWAGLLIARGIGVEDEGTPRSGLEAIVFAVMGAVWIVWLLRYRHAILKTDYLVLLAAMAGFGMSVLVDLSSYVLPGLEPESMRMRTTVAILEEMLKLTGILLMLAYVARVAASVFRKVAEGRAVG